MRSARNDSEENDSVKIVREECEIHSMRQDLGQEDIDEALDWDDDSEIRGVP